MEGSSNGILYFFLPQWELLQSPGVWADATSQVFFSFGIAWGTLIVLSSFNKVNDKEFSIFFCIQETIILFFFFSTSSKTIATLMQFSCRSLTLVQPFTMVL